MIFMANHSCLVKKLEIISHSYPSRKWHDTLPLRFGLAPGSGEDTQTGVRSRIPFPSQSGYRSCSRPPLF
jgi:hypothetical protein